MGLLIQTSFETPEGFAVSSVYCRIKGVSFDPIGSGEYTITMQPETHISRERRLDGKRPVSTPGLPNYLSIRGAFGDMTSVYGLLKTHLEAQGLTVEDVLEPAPEPTPEVSQQSSESTQTTPPTPPQPEAPQE